MIENRMAPDGKPYTQDEADKWLPLWEKYLSEYFWNRPLLSCPITLTDFLEKCWRDDYPDKAIALNLGANI